MRRGALLALAGVGIFVALLAIGAYAVFDSERGSRWALELGLSMSPVTMVVEGMEGTLLDGVHVRRFELTADAVVVTAERVEIIINWSESIRHRAIVVDDLRVSLMDIQRRLQPHSPPKPIEFALPTLPVTLDLATVEIEHLSTNLVDATYHPSLRFGAYLGNDVWRLANVELAAPGLRAQGHVEVEPSDAMAVSGAFGFRMNDLELRGDAALGGDLASLRVDVDLKAPLAARITSRVSILGRDSPELDAEIQTETTQFRGVEINSLTGEVRTVLVSPLQFDANVKAERLIWEGRSAGEVHVVTKGTLDAYNLQVTGSIVVPELPQAEVRVDVMGTATALESIDYSIKTPSGALRGSGTAAFDPVSINLVTEIDALDPGYFVDFLSGQLSGTATVAISADHLEVDVQALSGTVNEQQITMSGKVSRAADVWHVDNVHANAGVNTLSGHGTWSEAAMALDGQFDLQQIEHFYPDVVGDARGIFSARGAMATPDVRVELDAGSIVVAGAKVRRLRARATVLGGRIESATATAEDARFADMRFANPAILVSGHIERFTAETRFKYGVDESLLRWTGFWRDRQLGLDLAPGGRVAAAGEALINESVAQLRWRTGALSISAHCWSRVTGAGRLCIHEVQLAGTSRVSGSLVDLPVSVLTALLPQLPGTEGVVGGRWNFGFEEDGDWRGGAELTTSKLALVELGSVDDEPVLVPDIAASISVTGSGIQVDASMGGQTDGVIALRLTMDGYGDDAPIGGHLTVNAENLGALSQFSRRVGDVSGSMRGRFEFAGTRAVPRLDGKIEFDHGRFVWLDPHIEIDELDIDITMPEPQRIEVRGSGVTDRGRVELAGLIIDPFLASRRLTLDIDAKKVDVGIPEGTVRVNADLQLTFQNTEFELRGKVDVPRARIEVSALPESSVQRSRDVIVVDRTIEVEQVTRLAVDLDLTLGDDVRFKGFGLNTKLTGRLRLRQARDGGVRLDGTLNLKEGTFGAFGQTLTLESGRLVFAGPPDNPLVSARAVRTIEEPARTVKVGVDIKGRAGAIESTLFASPPMPEADTLSYLVLGRPLSAASQQESGDLTGAAIALGLKGAAPIVDEIRSTLGLEELTATGGSSEELALIAGKRISEHVYVRYSYQTFSRMSALLVRLVLNNRLSLEATAAQSPAMDLIYRVGPDG